jgi:hypothetical protein
MTRKNIDFSSNLRSLYSSKVPASQDFVEGVVDLLKAKVVDYNNRNLSGKVNLPQLKEVYKRGIHDAIRLDKPIGFWAIARVNMFLRYAKGAKVEYSYKKLDRDILNDPSFFIDDGVRDDIIFTYEQVSEAKFEVESFNLINYDENYDFVDLEEFSKDSFPKQPDSSEEG